MGHKRNTAAPAERLLEAERRARDLGVRLVERVVARKYESQSQSLEDTVYTQERDRDGWGCSCDGYRWTGLCKHLGAVALRAEREGWQFGAVAGLADDAAAPGPANVTPIGTLDERAARHRAALAELFGVDAG